MDKQELYIYYNRIERVIKDIELCLEYDCEPVFNANDEALSVGAYAENLLSYIMSLKDEDLMLQCCKLKRSMLYKCFTKANGEVEASLRTCQQCLLKIHDITLSYIFGVSDKDIKEDKYYINTCDGRCKDTATSRIIISPINTTINKPQQKIGDQSGMSADKIRIFDKSIKMGYMEKTETGYRWNESKVLLAYLIERLYCKNVTDEFPNTAMCNLFGEIGLKQAQNQYKGNKKTDGKPRGFEKIDALFE